MSARPRSLRIRCRARVDEILNRRPAVGLAVGVVRDGRLEFFHGHGLADIASNTPITEDTVFRIGSITKLFTAIAVMQLCEQGLVDLDAPANDYLRAYQLIPAEAGFRPATLRHLLTHTAGIPDVRHVIRPAPCQLHCRPAGDRRSSAWTSESGCRRSPSTTAAACGWSSSPAPPSPTATTATRRSARSSRT